MTEDEIFQFRAAMGELMQRLYCWYDLPEVSMAFQQVWACIPEPMREELIIQAIESEMLPFPESVDSDGKPIYSIEGLAKDFGVNTFVAKFIRDRLNMERWTWGLNAILEEPATESRG